MMSLHVAVYRVERRCLRAGYMGHVTQLANTLQYASEERAEVAQHVTNDPDWQHYLTSSLQPQNMVCFCKPRGLIYCRV